MGKEDKIQLVDNMEPGELELRKVFEDTTTHNLKTVIDYTTATRVLIRESLEKVEHMERLLQQQNETIAQLREQLAIIQGKLYVNGS